MPFGYEPEMIALLEPFVKLDSSTFCYAPSGQYSGFQIPFATTTDLPKAPFVFRVSIQKLGDENGFKFGFLVKPDRSEQCSPENGAFVWLRNAGGDGMLEGRLMHATTPNEDVFICLQRLPTLKEGGVFAIGHDGKELYVECSEKRTIVRDCEPVETLRWCPFIVVSGVVEINYEIRNMQ